MRSPTTSRWTCYLLAVVALLALAASASAQIKPGLGDPYAPKVMAEGKGWKLLETYDPALGERQEGTLVWMVMRVAVPNLPISQFQRDALEASMTELTDADDSEIFFADVTGLDALEAGTLGPDPDEGGELLANCGWRTRTKDKNYSFSDYSHSNTFTLGSVNGTYSVNIPLSGQANLHFEYEEWRPNLLLFCGPPLWWRFKFAHVDGNVAVSGDGDLSASASIGDTYSNEWLLFEPTLGQFTFYVGIIPVRIKVTLPTYVGASLTWNLTATVGVDADFGASGTFNYDCTKDACTGTNTFTDNFDIDDVTASLEADIDAQLNARVMARVALYDDSFAYVEAGIKGLLDGELWGYYGNTCGDADGDGHNETVQALAIDLGWGYDIVYGIGGFLLPDRTWTSMGPRYPLGWYDLLGAGGSTALQPMLLGPATVTEDQSVSYTVKMRPCYHYPEQVNFTIAPGTWSGNKFIPMPKSTVPSQNSSQVSRSFNTPGNPTLVVTNTTDGDGRDINVSYSRTITVDPACTDHIPPTVAVTSPAPGERIWGNATLAADASDNTGVNRVDFKINGATKCSDTTEPYSCTTNVDGYPTGDYTFKAVAYDTCNTPGTSAEVTARIVSNPEMYVETPTEGGTVSGSSVSVRGWATDPDGISEVTVTIDEQTTLPVTYGSSRPDVCSAVPVEDPNCPNVGFNTTLDSTLFTNGGHSMEVVARDAQNKTTTINRSFNVDNPLTPCVPDATTLCLRNNRFKVQAQYVNGGGFGSARAVPYSDQSGFFWFFSSTNIEASVKVLGPAGGYYWVFTGAATDREFTLAVTDTETGEVQTYVKPAGSFCGTPDTQAFPDGSSPFAPPGGGSILSFSEPATFNQVGKVTVIDPNQSLLTCTSSSTAICVQGDRFLVEVLRGGVPQPANELTTETGTFWFFDPSNQEVFVKVLDGNGINGHYWVFYGASSNQEYTVRVTDTETGQVVTYDNPPGNYCGNGDIVAFPAP